MKILFIARSSYDIRFILSSLVQLKPEVHFYLILETGAPARRRKIKRFFKRYSLLTKYKGIIDIFAIASYHHICMHYIKDRLGKHSLPPKIDILGTVDDVNSEALVRILDKNEFALTFNYGTSIYSSQTLHRLQSPLLNIHCSVLPYYRNVHSDFWAFILKDYSKIGVSIFKIDSGIDTGGIVTQEVLNSKKTQSIIDIKVSNLELIVKLISTLIDQFKKSGTLNTTPQNADEGSRFPTPRLHDLLKLLTLSFKGTTNESH